MNRFLKSVSLFLLFSVIAYPLMIFVWGTLAPSTLRWYSNLYYRLGYSGHMLSRIQELENVADVDLMILGSSHAYREYDPRIFAEYGIKIFNLGSSGQTPMQTRILLERYLDKLSPETIIFEVYPGTFCSDGVESSLDIIESDDIGSDMVRMAFHINNMKTYNNLIFGYSRELLGMNSGFVEPVHTRNNTYISGGYVEKELMFYEYTEHPSKRWNWNSDQFASFEGCLSMIRERNIDLILIYTPITSSFYDSHEDNTEYDSIMNGYGTYYNFNGEVELDDSLHFYDAHHLNQDGVVLYNRTLLEVLIPELVMNR